MIIPRLAPKEARRQGMCPITQPALESDPFVQNVMKDMASITGTNWALVSQPRNEVEVWRVKITVPVRR